MLKNAISPKAAISRYWDEHWQTMPREQMDQIQFAKTKRLIRYAYENVGLYRRLYEKAGITPDDICTWDDFYNRVPFVDKPDFLADQSNAAFGGLGLELQHGLQIFQTTGTTGTPLRELLSAYDENSYAQCIAGQYWDLGLRPGDTVYFTFHFGIWVGFWTYYWAARKLGLQILSGGGLGSEDRVRQILTLKPTVVLGTPTYLLHLADLAASVGKDVREAGVRYLIGGGEPGFSIEATRRVLGERWGVGNNLADGYGIGECSFSAMECNAHAGGVHLPERTHHSYCIDPESGKKVGEGQVGELVVTALCRAGQIFIKYRTHDLVERYENFDHGCGWTWAFLKGCVLGRTDNMIVIRGVNVYPAAVENLLGQVSGTTNYFEMHITREEGMDRMKVKVEAADNVDPAGYPDLAQRTEEVYRTVMGVRLEVEVVPPNTLPRYELKTKRFFDHRPSEVRLKLDRS